MTGKPVGISSVFDQWSLYEKIIHLNYMRHREIGDAVRSFTRRLSEPLHVLDLGCGDGWMACQGLRDSMVATYVGVDLSADALDQARVRLSNLSCSLALRQSSFVEALTQKLDPRPSLVLASYSLHHLPDEQQASLINRLGEIAAAGGWLVWIDLQRGQQESRDEYLQRFFQQGIQAWKALSDAEVEEVIDHMTTADFPLTATEKRQIAASAGFQPLATIFQDDYYAADIYALGTQH